MKLKHDWLSLMKFAPAMLIATATGCGVVPPGNETPLATVEKVDVARYMGRWYEIAKYPNSFQGGCQNVTADYTLKDDGTVRVVNTCRSADGLTETNRIEGFANIADSTTNAKLTVYFFFPFGAPYWIIDLDADYQYAVVGDPSRTFLWILSRTPTLEPETYEQILQRLPEKGYDPARLELTPQLLPGGLP